MSYLLCALCKQPMLPEEDCGGDCVRCMAELGDVDCIKTVNRKNMLALPAFIKPEEVFVDIQPWLAAIDAQRPDTRIPMTGVLRHADLLARRFTPACIVMPGETHHCNGAVELLESYLERKIKVIEREAYGEVFTLEEDLAMQGCQVWLSIAPDCTGPAVTQHRGRGRSYIAMTIVHDVQATERTFGETNQANFMRSTMFSDVFLCVSEYAVSKFLDFWECRKINDQEFNVKRLAFPSCVNYSCTHGYYELPPFTPKPTLKTFAFEEPSWFSMSLHSIYPHKNLRAVGEVVEYFETHHVHVGAFVRSEETEILDCIEKGVHFSGHLSDESSRMMMGNCELFICLSTKEGFSMPPMEAILEGCPRIVLSDIPAHREIYGCTPGVVFVDAEDPTRSLLDQSYSGVYNLPVTTGESRQTLYERFHPDTVLAPLLDWLKAPTI